MVIWSILTEEAWRELQRKGRLRVSSRQVTQDFLAPYAWMAAQMECRLRVPRPSTNAMPIWAWYQWEGAARRKPDLRAGGHLPKGVRGVRVECHVEDERVLLSDFDLWHYVLNYWYLPETEKDGEAFEKKLTRVGLSFYKCDHQHPLQQVQYRREIEQSWERIFDLAWADRRHSIASPPKKKSVQATLWELALDNVIRAKKFTAK